MLLDASRILMKVRPIRAPIDRQPNKFSLERRPLGVGGECARDTIWSTLMVSESSRPRYRLDRRQVLGSMLATAVPALVRPASAAAAKNLVVGALPVTCNLTLPVACVAKTAANAADKSGAPQVEFEFSKYSGWPEVKESLMGGRIQAAYMLAPLVMDLADKRIPVKIVSLGHRSGAVIMVRTDSSYQHFKELAGKRVAIPSRFAVDYLFLRKMLARENMTPRDVQ